MKRLTLLFCFILFFTANIFAEPTGITLYVNSSAAPGGDGTSWAAAFTSLQDALDLAGFNDQIWVAAGLYTPSVEVGGTGERYKSFQLKNNVSIFGGFAGTETNFSERTNLTIIANPTILSGEIGDPGTDADNCFHVIYNTAVLALDETSVLDGFVITDGTANDIVNVPNNLGGGILNLSCSPTIMNCTIIGCRAYYGGGIYILDSSPEITNCLFLNNISDGEGGALYCDNSSLIITNSIFCGNSSSITGGAISYYSGSPDVMNCTFVSNVTGIDGGGIFFNGSNLDVTNSIFFLNFINTGSVPSEISGDTPANVTYCCITSGNSTGFPGAGNIFSDPLFVGPGTDGLYGTEDDNLGLQNESLCIGAGTATGAPAFDILNFPRTGNPDLGAVENARDVPLPVELISFTASSADNGIILKWVTATEVDNYGFEIERASLGTTPCQDGLKWEKIGFVDGAGNSNSPKQYSFVDANPASGIVQYRLKQINTNGSSAYFNQIAEVNYLTDVNGSNNRVPTEFALDQNYPNPFNPTTKIKYAVGSGSVGNNSNSSLQFVSLKIYDILGNEVTTLVNEHKAPGYYEVEFSAGSLATGVYIYRLTAGEFTTVKKLMLLK